MMKLLFTALALVALVAAPAVTQRANAAPTDRDMYRGHVPSYQGYPLNEWYRPDNW
jgi:hypothetical protein